MKFLSIIAFTVFGAVTSHGQINGFVFPVTPATPTDFIGRNVGATVNGTAILVEPPVPQKIKVAFTVVSPLRAWTNSKGKALRGSLIAFETGDHSQSSKELTIVRDGKVRLLIEGNNNFNLIALSNFRKKDQDYIIELVSARKEAAAVKE